MSTMKQTTPAKIINVGKKIALECYLEAGKTPYIIYEKKRFDHLHAIIKAIPDLANPKQLEPLACLVNFMAKGEEYQIIENTKQFQEEYLNQIEFERNSLDYIPDRLIDHGIFDVKVMHSPRIINDEFIFFVKNMQSGIPNRVNCPYPISNENPKILYQLLPYALE